MSPGRGRRCRTCAPVPEELLRAADLLERRWTLSVLFASMEGAARFNEFRQAVAGIPPNTLSERLRELEEAGVLERRLIAASPPFAEYLLTERGRRLGPVVRAVRKWVLTT
jgi:DNA-binding HxlR family transcriptional regulator